MLKKHYLTVVLFLIVAVVIVVPVSVARAQSGVPAGFCEGTQPIVFESAVPSYGDPCGGGMYKLVQPWYSPGGPYNPTLDVDGTWDEVIGYLHANGLNSGSIWRLKTSAPPSGGGGFCSNKEAFIFGPDGQSASVMPNCGSGTYMVVKPWSDSVPDGGNIPACGYTAAIAEMNRWKGGSVWYEGDSCGGSPLATPSGPNYTPVPPPPPTDGGAGLPWWAWLLIVIGAICLILFIIWLIRRRNAQQQPQPPQQNP